MQVKVSMTLFLHNPHLHKLNQIFSSFVKKIAVNCKQVD